MELKPKCKKSVRTLTAQPECDRAQENVPAVVAAVVALRRVVSVKQDQTSVRRDSVPRQRRAAVQMPRHRYPAQGKVRDKKSGAQGRK